MKRAAIIELSESHGECIYSQVLFLKDSVDKLHLIVNSALKDQTENNFTNVTNHYFKSFSTIGQQLKTYLYIRKILKTKKIDTLILNTATGTQIWELIKFVPKSITILGSMHDANKFIRSSTQKRINKRVKKYFVLNDYIQDYVISNNINDISTQSYYPVFFPEIEKINLEKKENEFWITIPGKVEQKRRDYLAIIESLKDQNLADNIKFILLGRCKNDNLDCNLIFKKISEYHLESNFVIFNSFVSSDQYFSYLAKSDIIMPAVEPGVEFYNTYKKSQITGAYNLAFGFGIPLFFNEDLNNIRDLTEFGIGYNHTNIYKKLIDLTTNKSILSVLQQKIKNEKKFSIEYQTTNYLSFINSYTKK